MKKLIFLLLTLLVSFSFATPQFFTYQGVARNAQGQPLQNTNISLRLQILETSIAGNVVYEETQSATTNDLGLFVLKVGMGTATQGNFSQIDWGSDDHFLQVEMDPTGGSSYQMMGTSQLASVPYALYAESSGGDTTLWQKNPVGINYNSGKVGIGTTSPAYSLDIQDSIAALRLQSSSSVHGSGLILIPGNSANQWWITSQPGIAANPNPGGLNFLKRYPDAFGNIVSEHIMDITDAGYVGIGTRTPTTKLQVSNGDVHIDGGRLGIGTDNPAFTLEVIDGFAGMRLESNSGIHGSGFILAPSSSTNEWWITSQPGIAANPNPGGLNFLKRYPDAFGNIVSEHIMDITDAGNVGIGTRTPKTKLQVSDGDIYIEDINKGVIMRSPNGSCWRMTVSNSGQPVLTSIICP